MTEPAVGYIYNFSYFCVHNICAAHSFNEHNNNNSAYPQTLHCNNMKWNVLTVNTSLGTEQNRFGWKTDKIAKFSIFDRKTEFTVLDMAESNS